MTAQRTLQDVNNCWQAEVKVQLEFDTWPPIVAFQGAIQDIRPTIVSTNARAGERESYARVEEISSEFMRRPSIATSVRNVHLTTYR